MEDVSAAPIHFYNSGQIDCQFSILVSSIEYPSLPVKSGTSLHSFAPVSHPPVFDLQTRGVHHTGGDHDRHHHGSTNGVHAVTVVDWIRHDPRFPMMGRVGSALDDMYVEATLYAGSVPGLLRISDTVRTAYRQHARQRKNIRHIQSILSFNVRLCDLPSDAVVCISVYDVFSPRKKICIGGAVFPLFSYYKTQLCSDSDDLNIQRIGPVLHSGRQRVQLIRGVSGEELLVMMMTRSDQQVKTTATPCNASTVHELDHEEDEISRLERLFLEHHRRGLMGGDQAKHQWLDRITSTRINEISRLKSITAADSEADKDKFFVNFEMQAFDYPVVFAERDAELLSSQPAERRSKAVHKRNQSLYSTGGGSGSPQVVVIEAPERGQHCVVHDIAIQDNPADTKHLKMSMNLWRGIWDKELTPDYRERSRLLKVADYTPLAEISTEERVLMWRYRYWIVRSKKLLTKFLRCVDWSHEREKCEALQLLSKWSPIEIIDALELLSKQFEDAKEVRTYAVNILKKTSDEELLGILLQLVQALRYEQWFYSDGTRSDVSNAREPSRNQPRYKQSSLATFLLRRAAKCFEICNFLFWYLNLETEDSKYGTMYRYMRDELVRYITSKKSSRTFYSMIRRQQILVRNLTELCNEVKSTRWSEVKIERLRQSVKGFNTGESPTWKGVFSAIDSDPKDTSLLMLPLNPNIGAVGINADDATIFSSNAQPIRLSFLVPKEKAPNASSIESSSFEGKNQGVSDKPADADAAVTANNDTDHALYRVIFKTGDDLRQDQLVIQVIEFIDSLLKKNNLDLKLTPYRVLACNGDFGFIECVTPSAPLSSIGDVRKWLRQHANDDDARYRQALDNFVKSCAGYCVITYILGIGDRHLDNLMCTPDGRLFHIDFGFMLGKDPKFGAPPMKLCKEMVEGMGGSNSASYHKFVDLCCTTYNVLRRHSTTILNLFTLMIDANIKDIDDNAQVSKKERRSSKTRSKRRGTYGGRAGTISSSSSSSSSSMSKIRNHNIMKIQEKLQLELNDEQAILYMQTVIRESDRALFGEINEYLHRWAMYWKRL